MPTGVVVDCFCVLVGGLIGAKFKHIIPMGIKDPLTVVFGICAIAIGILSFVKVNSLPVVIFSLIVGSVIGELLHLEARIKSLFEKVINRFNFAIDGDANDYMRFYVLVAITFCASGTNIFGAMNEGVSGDMSILLSKAAMDIFASIIFATTLGYAMNLIVIPQFIFLSGCFYLAKLMMPIVTTTMLADFIATGGLLTIILGLSIAKIKQISAANLLPALVAVLPVSYLYTVVGTYLLK